MSVKRLFTLRNFHGIVEKVSPRDIPEESLTKCENWDIDSEFGKLKAGKGWSDLIDANLGSGDGQGMIEVAQPRDGDDVSVLLAQDTDTKIARWRYDGSSYGSKSQLDVTTIDSLATIDKLRSVEYANNIMLGTGNKNSNTPFWYGYLNYYRFALVSGGFNEDKHEYYFNRQHRSSFNYTKNTQATTGAPSSDEDIVIRFNSEDTSSTAETYYMRIVAVPIYQTGEIGTLLEYSYDGLIQGAIFPWQSNKHTNIKEIYFDDATPMNYKSVYFDLYVKKGIRDDITGVMLFVWTGASSDDEVDGYKYWRTIYFDETKKNEYDIGKRSLGATDVYDKWVEETTGDFAGYYHYAPLADVSGAPSSYYLNFFKDRDYSGAYLTSILGYDLTFDTMTSYKYSRIVNNINYVGNIYNYPYLVRYSPPGQPNILPDVNYIRLEDAVSGIGSLRDKVILFTENTMNIYTGNVFEEKYSEYGCVSHDGIIEHSGILYWPGKYGIYAYNGFYPVKISAIAIDKSYNELSLDEKREIIANIDLKNNRIIWSVPSSGKMFIYMLDAKEWVTKSTAIKWLAQDARQNLMAVSGDDIFRWDDGYNYPTIYGSAVSVVYNCDALTKKIDLRESGIIKTLMFGYIGYKSPSNNVVLKILYEDTVYTTITLGQTSTMKQERFSLGGLKIENFQIEIYVEGVSGDVEIDFIDIWGDVNYIK